MPLASSPSPVERAKDAMIAADRRVATIGYQLESANIDRCPAPGFAPGLVLQAADQFDRSERDAAMRAFGVSNRVTVSVVVPGSPAAAAAMNPGDELLAIDGRPVPPVPVDRATASYVSVREALDAIGSAAARHDRLIITVSRAGHQVMLTLNVTRGCAIRVQLVPSREINGFADDSYATITTGLERFATDDDELALFLAHELAHAFLRHAALLDRSAPLHGLLGRTLLPARTVLKTEQEADALGMTLAARAGFDVSRAPDFWRRLDAASPDTGFIKTHPGTRDRVAAAQRDAAAIKRRQDQHLPL